MSERAVGRLSIYRRLLSELADGGSQNVYSHELAKMSGFSAAQVRRDLMAVGYSGSPAKGYGVSELVESIGHYLDDPVGQGVALVGVGNLGRAILAYFSGRRPRLAIVAAFDNDPKKTGRDFHGCRCCDVADMVTLIRKKRIDVGIITVPQFEAQEVADLLVKGGVRGILNFAPATIEVPERVYVENVDITVSLEKVAFFARHSRPSNAK